MAHATIEKFLNSANGRPMDPDKAYGYQCVDVVDQYGQEIFGVRWQECVGGVQSAKQLLDVVPDAFWHRIDNRPTDPSWIPLRGDVIVWGGDKFNAHGHTALILNATPDFVEVLQQDGMNRTRPAHIVKLKYYQPGTGHVLGWLRPREAKIVKARIPYCIVEKGDTFAGIARQFFTSVDHLRAVNPGININVIHPGQRINLP